MHFQAIQMDSTFFERKPLLFSLFISNGYSEFMKQYLNEALIIQKDFNFFFLRNSMHILTIVEIGSSEIHRRLQINNIDRYVASIHVDSYNVLI